MANWKKLAVSGSATSFPQLKVDTSITASIFSGSQFIGSLTGTASYASNANTAISSSYALSATSASYALSASYTPGSGTAVSASYALSASYASNASTADSATSASRATSAANADNATSASYASTASFAQSGNGTFSGSFSGSFQGDGGGLTNIPASGIVGLQLNQIASGSATASIAPDLGFRVNTDTQITGSLSISSSAATLKIEGNGFSQTYFSTNGALVLNPGSGGVGMAGVNQYMTLGYVVGQTAGTQLTGSFTGSFKGDGGGLTNVPASGIVGLQLNQIGSGSVTASIAPDLGFRVNTDSQITGSLKVTGNINTGGTVISTVAGSSLTGSFTGSFAGNFVGTSNLPDLTQGAGVTAFTYDGSTTATVAVSGASGLSNNTVTKWTGNAFANSSITDGANVTINSAGGVYVQGGGIDVSGSSTFHDNVVMQGNLTVQGTASFQNVDNLAVKDQFILLNSGSSTFQDSGIVINTGNSSNSGSAFFLETSGTTTGTNGLYGRFAVGINVLPDATSATAAEYANTTVISGSAPGNATPQFGGTGLGQGNTWVDTSTSDIWIYA